ncbi:hypothetical protein SEPCBS57363_004263 [Sporothrix epigloea]|uniref:Xylanolytic transcriptional activator regulatory domain-containing protein n=1 Tax=Sporothrix epigloea TaxID=1892477 RepID=A0ABP0DV47_9PEZI
MSPEAQGELSVTSLQQRQFTGRYTAQSTPPVPSLAHLGRVSHPPDNSALLPQPPLTAPQLVSRNVSGCNLDLLSDAATRLASAAEVSSIPPNIPELGHSSSAGPVPPVKPFDSTTSLYNDRSRVSPPPLHPLPQDFSSQPPAALFDDCHLFLDDFTPSSHFFPTSLEPDQSTGMWGRPANELGRGGGITSKMNRLSFPSTQWQSVQPYPHDLHLDPSHQRSQDESLMRAPAWRIGLADHNSIKSRLEEFSSVLPADFVCPSRHTLTRFLEGYVSGFHEHLPFLHLPTLLPGEMSPELILAILAVGAQYRFESHRSNALCSPNTPQARLQTIQALLLLFAAGLWGPKAILHEALSLQSQLAVLVREEGLESQPSSQVSDWDTWIRVEGSARTKLIAFCFFNLCSVVYNTPPMLLTSEINLFLPQPSRFWRCETAGQWQKMYQAYPIVELPLQEVFSRLLDRSAPSPPSHTSSLGNYVLMHCFIQHIYLLKQTSVSAISPYGVHRGLKLDDIEEVAHGLRLWQIGFEQHRQLRSNEQGYNMSMSPDGYIGNPVSFNATALLRLAYIRLYTDLNTSRRLETRDHVMIANAFNNVPLLVRSPRTIRAVIQAIHALAMLVKAGVNYVARTKSLEWSIQLSLCNMECALLLSKWLATLASIGPNDEPISSEEKALLGNVRRLLDETEFAVPIDPSLSGSGLGTSATPGHQTPTSDGAKLRQLATAVTHLWAETFKGTHVFEVIGIMGMGLESYAGILEKAGDQPAVVRIAATSSL